MTSREKSRSENARQVPTGRVPSLQAVMDTVFEVSGSSASFDEASLLIADCRLDDIELFQLELSMGAFFGGFVLPDQFAIDDVTIRDLHHYLRCAIENAANDA